MNSFYTSKERDHIEKVENSASSLGLEELQAPLFMVPLHLDTACRSSTQVLWPMTYKFAGALSPPRVDSSTCSQINRVLLHTYAYRATLTPHHVPHLAPEGPTGCCGMGTLDFSAWTLFWLLTVDKQSTALYVLTSLPGPKPIPPSQVVPQAPHAPNLPAKTNQHKDYTKVHTKMYCN